MTALDQVLVFDADPGRAASIAAILKKTGPEMIGRSVTAFHDLKSENYGSSPGVLQLQTGLPALAVVVESGGGVVAFNQVPEIARRHGVATLLIVDPIGDPKELIRRARAYDRWMFLDSVDRELTARVAEVLDWVHQQAANRSRLTAIDSRFLAVAIHDLRTPLNVIWLTIRAIFQTVPERSAALDEDLTFLQDNALQIKDMLEQLSDYCRLMDGNAPLSDGEFDPRRFLSDLLEDRRGRSGAEPPPLHLELGEDCPSEVALDQARVRLALKHALDNTITAAGGAPVRVRSGGGPDRWIIELIVDKAPPAHVVSMPIRPDAFERLVGSAAERRGLDLAIAARISELLGGSARLEVEPARRSTVVLDWPRRIAID